MLNNVWGYVDETGIEYALVGTRDGVSILSLADPSNPVEVHWHQGTNSIWRELKTHGDYLYVTTEAQSGLLIIDLSPLPNGPITTEVYYQGPPNATWKSAHSLYIEDGYCYIFGANRGHGGAIILDVATDPLNPIEVGKFDNWYVHDGFARGNRLYLANIYQGFFSVVDITDKSNPTLLGTALTPHNFTHNVWLSQDSEYIFTTDEVSGAFITAYNISDINNMFEVDRIQSNPGSGVVPHNVHVRGQWAISSYYTDGITIHDVTHPNNMIEVGNFDTTPLQNTSMQGCWGAYPYLPSGLILASDIEEGLYVLEPNYKQACYLQGQITDASNGNSLQGAKIKIIGDNQMAQSNLTGHYATGIAGTGSYNVEFSRPLYFPQTHSISLVEGQTTTFNVNLQPIPSYNVTVVVQEAGSNQPILDAQVRVETDLHQANNTTNGLGEAEMTLYYEGLHKISVGKWGYFTQCFDTQINAQTGQITVVLNKGYFDDFTFDFGWSTTSTAQYGAWVREKPIANIIGSAPGADAPMDCDDKAYVTGNGSVNQNFDQVVNGVVTLISPVFDLTGYSDPHVNYWTWYFNLHGANPNPNDTLNITLSNGITNARIEYKAYPESPHSSWQFSSIRVLDHIQPTENMQLFIQISDFNTSPNLVEAGFDYFSVSNSNTVSVDDSEPKLAVRAIPNPSQGIFTIDGTQEIQTVRVFDSLGRTISSEVQGEKMRIKDPAPGIYTVHLTLNSGRMEVLKIVVAY